MPNSLGFFLGLCCDGLELPAKLCRILRVAVMYALLFSVPWLSFIGGVIFLWFSVALGITDEGNWWYANHDNYQDGKFGGFPCSWMICTATDAIAAAAEIFIEIDARWSIAILIFISFIIDSLLFAL